MKPQPFADATISVMLVEDSYLVRMGVAALIAQSSDLKVVAEASDGLQAIELYRTHQPRVVVADLKMPHFDGIALLNVLKKENPPARVLVLTQYEGDESIRGAIVAGALGYVTKETPGAQVLDAIRKVANGQRYVPIEIASRLAERNPNSQLTPRESQVLELLCKGLSNRGIAEELQVAERTVGVYVSGILTKLEVKSRTEAIASALRRGFVRRD
ncbi:MAG: response regulator transcription factor [Deltaproteobacteria bacterium]|nr:response regulator transcription factor [Deltaproteobacteria bacterium]